MKAKLIILFTAILMITSCVSNNQVVEIANNPNLPNTLENNDSMDTWTNRLDVESLSVLQASNESFMLYLGNPTCSSCTRFQPQLKTWILETSAMVYYLDTLEQLHQLSTIQEQFPNYFPEGFSTPVLYVLNGEERIHRIGPSEAFFSYPRFKALMASYVSIAES